MNTTLDWRDFRFALFVGVAVIIVELTGQNFPDLHVSRTTGDIFASTLVLGYIFYRCRREPDALNRWGLSTPLSFRALLWAVFMLGFTVLMLALGALSVGASPDWQPHYATEMLEYIPAAFPQQFFMCSVGLVMLSTLPLFRRPWVLALAVGVVFSLAHFWTPAKIPGTIIPLQMVLTLPAGFGAALYFLVYRNIAPLTLVHAISYPLLNHWIERQL
ncbi:MAG: hypothetical protein RLZZ303_1155 [Candidatus Hydrogenedentota bacterium]|jgi:hypothetical protein